MMTSARCLSRCFGWRWPYAHVREWLARPHTRRTRDSGCPPVMASIFFSRPRPLLFPSFETSPGMSPSAFPLSLASSCNSSELMRHVLRTQQDWSLNRPLISITGKSPRSEAVRAFCSHPYGRGDRPSEGATGRRCWRWTEVYVRCLLYLASSCRHIFFELEF